jgi:hypothetical protein
MCARPPARGWRKPPLFDHIEDRIRQTVPASQTESIVDNIGMTVSGINMAYSNNGGIGPQDGDILITLKEGTALRPIM